MKYIVQIDMAEFGEPAIWQDVAGVEFDTMKQAVAHIKWMKSEYGDKIDYCVATRAPITSTPAYYEQDGGSMCNGIGRSYF